MIYPVSTVTVFLPTDILPLLAIEPGRTGPELLATTPALLLPGLGAALTDILRLMVRVVRSAGGWRAGMETDGPQ